MRGVQHENFKLVKGKVVKKMAKWDIHGQDRKAKTFGTYDVSSPLKTRQENQGENDMVSKC